MRKQIYRQISNFLANKKLVRGFTISELLVAIGLLAVVLAASTTIFHYSIEAQRTAMATTEIMHSLRAITDQLNADFAGFRSDMPVGLEFIKNTSGSNEIRTDNIVFFSTGDFQTMDGTARGNVARIYYGQSSSPEPNSFEPAIRRSKILVRKQVILAPDSSLPTLPSSDVNEYEGTFPIAQSRKFLQTGTPPYIPPSWNKRPDVNDPNEKEIPMYLAKGVDNFTIQFGKVDPNGSIKWHPTNAEVKSGTKPNSSGMIRFTFTIYDSKGILKQGRKFEHIVYIGN